MREELNLGDGGRRLVVRSVPDDWCKLEIVKQEK